MPRVTVDHARDLGGIESRKNLVEQQ